MVNPKSLKNLTPYQPGQTGNPAGAPKGKRWRTVIAELMEQPAIFKSDDMDAAVLEIIERKLERKLTNRDAIAIKQIMRAHSETPAFRALADREEGRPARESEDLGVGADLPDFEVTNDQVGELLKIARGNK